MEIVLKLKLSGSKYATDTRNAFWREYCNQAGLPFEDEDYAKGVRDGPYSPDRLEAMVRSRFVARLNDALAYRFGRRGDGPGRMIVVGESSPPLADIVLTLNRLEYGSLDLIMKVFGLEDGALLPLLCGALEVYASDAFGNAMPGNNVELTAIADYDRAQAVQNTRQVVPVEGGPATLVASPGIKELARNRLWGILNGSLILPVILALAVTYQMANSVDRDRAEIANERALLAQERIAIVQSLSQQDAAMTRMIIDRMEPKQADGRKKSASAP